MGTHRIALYSTLYPQVLRFVPAWRDSLAQQTDSTFDLWLGIDGIPEDVLRQTSLDRCPVQYVMGSDQEDGISVRERAMDQIAARYEAVIFVDSDDLLLPTRVEAARAALENSDVAACALEIVGADAEPLGLRFGAGCGRGDWSPFLPRHNIFGLSNTAYRTEVLARCLPLPPGCKLVDWYLATRAWSLGARLAFDDVPRMCYRQYPGNIAPVVPPFSTEVVLSATRRVLHHYQTVLPTFTAVSSTCRRAIEGAQADVRRFWNVICGSQSLLLRYTTELNRLRPVYVWWWAVANESLADLWRI